MNSQENKTPHQKALDDKQELIVEKLKEKGSKLSDKTLLLIGKQLSPYLVKLDEDEVQNMRDRDSIWQLSMSEKGLKKNRVDNIVRKFNQLIRQ